MQCPHCSTEITISCKYCPSCGKQVFNPSDYRSREEVSYDWIRSLFISQGHAVTKEDRDESVFWTEHQEDPNYFVVVTPVFMAIQSNWTLETISWSNKKDFLEALNLANDSNWFIKYNSIDPYPGVSLSSAFYFSEKVSARDILEFIEVITTNTINALNADVLKKFLA
jgi:hypothetical protein